MGRPSINHLGYGTVRFYCPVVFHFFSEPEVFISVKSQKPCLYQKKGFCLYFQIIYYIQCDAIRSEQFDSANTASRDEDTILNKIFENLCDKNPDIFAFHEISQNVVFISGCYVNTSRQHQSKNLSNLISSLHTLYIYLGKN